VGQAAKAVVGRKSLVPEINMDNHWKPHETDEHRDIGAYQEMEYRLRSLRALVCDLLKTNQELRSALLDAGIDMRGGVAASSRAKPRPLV
jgi:hypothetical protein